VEAQEWAANFYAGGGHQSTIIKAALKLDEAEAAALKMQWTEGANNVPKIIDTDIDSVTETDVNPQGAQMLAAREFQNGEAARIFGMPGSLLEYGAPGSSLTYQNLSDVWVQFVRGCLLPNYLDPIEQALSDLLPRSQVVKLYVEGLQRADVKTRYDVYASGITSGVLTPEQAQQMEGIIPGNPDVAPVAVAPPAAIPDRLPSQLRSAPSELRCNGLRMRSGRMVACGKLLSKGEAFSGLCPRCKTLHVAA
jgi:HK97 family phage portal protein